MSKKVMLRLALIVLVYVICTLVLFGTKVVPPGVYWVHDKPFEVITQEDGMIVFPGLFSNFTEWPFFVSDTVDCVSYRFKMPEDHKSLLAIAVLYEDGPNQFRKMMRTEMEWALHSMGESGQDLDCLLSRYWPHDVSVVQIAHIEQ